MDGSGMTRIDPSNGQAALAGGKRAAGLLLALDETAAAHRAA